MLDSATSTVATSATTTTTATPSTSEAEDVTSTKTLEADRIFVLMQKDYRLSRNARATWYLSHLHGELGVKKYESCADFTSELDAVGIVPHSPPCEWDWDVSHLYRYSVTPKTAVRFLAQRYRFVFMLDLSPSTAASELLNKGVTSCSLLPALRKSLAGLVRPFYVPGSQLLLRPDIYVTVIAWTPFLSEACQAVLHQGWLLTPENLNAFMRDVVTGLHELEQRSSHVTAEVHGEMQAMRAESERMMGGLFDEASGTPVDSSSGIITATADAGFVSMIRTGMLALQLLPPNSAAGLVVVTDGVMSVPDIGALDAVLNQFRTKMVSLSFLQVSSLYSPQSGLTRVPYEELMEFASLGTYGAYLPEVPEVDTGDYIYDMNIYHDALLCWSFRKALQAIHLPNALSYYELFHASDTSLHAGWYTRGRFSGIKNGYFLHTNEERITKKKIETTVSSSLSSLLSCRLREGYTINEVNFSQDNSRIEVKLTLPWKISSFIHYVIDSEWPLKPAAKQSPCKIQVLLEGDYDTLHDIICQREKHFASRDRNSVIRKFYVMLQHLSYVDKLLVHLESFSSNKAFYTLPDSVANGVPLFHIPMNSSVSKPELSHEDFALLHPLFTSFWKPISSMDVNIWQRWLHTHRIHLLLNNDSPLPKHFLTPNSSGRYTSVQCRKAALQLSESLKRWSSFVLLDNSTFITFIRPDGVTEGPPSSFFIVRMTSKPPCVVIWIAFPGGTEGKVRHSILHSITEKIETLRIKQHATFLRHGDTSNEWPEIPACIIFDKPIERILIRYERMPHDIFHLLEPAYRSLSRQQSSSWAAAPFGAEHRSGAGGGTGALTFLSLSRYLHHRRWVWSIQASLGLTLSNTAITRILNTLARQRFHQGFHFAHSHQGIQTMARELTMKTGTGGLSAKSTEQPCLVQYVVFPPYTATTTVSDVSCSSISSSDDEAEEVPPAEDSELKIMTEIWVEPQDGIIVETVNDWPQMEGQRFRDISRQVFQGDYDIISTLATFEHLSMISQMPASPSISVPQDTGRRHFSSPSNTNVRQIPFQWNLGSLLEKSQQSEIFLATFIQSLTGNFSEESDLPNENLYDQLKEHICKLHDKEVILSAKDNDAIFEHLKTLPNAEGSRLRYPDRLIPPTAGTSRVSSRLTSGASLTSSSNTTAETDLRSVSSDKSNVPPSQGSKWVCYIKSLTTSHFLMTILPKTFGDLKSLLVDEASMDGQSPLALSLVQTPIPKISHTYQYPFWTPDESVASSMLSIDDSLRKRSQSGSNELRERLSAAAVRAKRAALKTRNDSIEISPSPSDSMRTRTMSIDSSALAAAERNRCKSMEFNNQKPPGYLSGGHKPPMTRVRTQTHSHAKQVNRTPTDSKTVLKAGPVQKPAKKVWGSATLPIYVFDSNVNNLIQHLLSKGLPNESPNDGITLDTRPESRVNEVKKVEPVERIASKDPLARMDKHLRLHCINLQMAYYKAFVSILYRSLNLKLPTHSFDVQSCIDYCDNEAVLETDMTEFLMKVCGHVHQIVPASSSQSSENDKEKEERREKGVTISFSKLQETKTCSQIFTNHSVIKKKFADILQTSFRPVPQADDLYFYCPSSSLLGDDYFPVPSRQRRDTKDTDDPISELDFPTSDRLKLFKDELDRDESMQEVGSLSLLSSAAASDDQSDLNDSETGESTPPLFLQVSVTIRRGREVLDNVHISELPTCLADLVKRSSPSNATTVTSVTSSNNFLEIDLGNFSVSLDLLCVTLPNDMTLPYRCEVSKRSTSLSSSLSLPEETSYLLEGLVHEESSTEEKLPSTQLESINGLISSFRFMLEDEIAFALTQATPITQNILAKVAAHIEASKDKPGCVLQPVPLHFVFGADKSLAIFLEMFGQLSLPGYQLRQEGKYFYLIQAPKSCEPSAQQPATSAPEESDPHSHSQQFQLSPVKELHKEEDEESVLGSSSASAETYAWRSDPGIEARRSCPTFWLILRVFSDRVSVYFQYREGQFDSVLPWRQAQQQVTSEIRSLCKKVNQKLLLEDLYESRQCNRLLETETTEEAWPSNVDDRGRQNSQFDTGEAYEVTFLEANLNVRFKPGSFSCSPPVWQTNFPLHPRVKQTQGGHHGGSIALHALKNVLNAFAVSNRSNMFVYRDDEGNIFYIKIFEIISGNVSRKVTAPPTYGKPPGLESNEELFAYNFSRSASICSWNGLDNCEPGYDDRIELKVYGITCPGTQITHDLVELLDRKLNEKVVEVISVMLQRNPMCKLTPEDVRFLQKPGPNSSPSSVYRFALHHKFRGSDMTSAISYYFRQNIVHQFATLPKYSSPLPALRFQDYSNGQLTSSSNVFLYNRVPSVLPKYGKTVGGGHRGIACIALSIVEPTTTSDGTTDECPILSEEELSVDDFEKFVTVRLLPQEISEELPDALVLQFNVWEQGRIDGTMKERLETYVCHSLWDVITELHLLPRELVVSSGNQSSQLSPLFSKFSTKWLDYGMKLGVSSVQKQNVTFSTKYSPRHTVKEMQNKVSMAVPDTRTEVFQKKNVNGSHVYCTCRCFGIVPSLPSSDPNFLDEYILIGRNFKHWQSCNNPSEAKPEELAPLMLRSMQKFQPFMLMTEAAKGRANSIGSKSIDFDEASFSETTSVASGGSGRLFISRQRILVAHVMRKGIELYTYNYSKECADRLAKQLIALGHWFSARSSLGSSIVAQKLGLFHNEKFVRPSGENPFCGHVSHIETLVKNYSPPPHLSKPAGTASPKVSRKKQDESFVSVYRDVKPAKAMQNCAYSIERDATSRHGRQLLEMLSSSERDMLHKIQTRAGENGAIFAEDVVTHFEKISRLVHICMTPLLFLPKWRQVAHSTRLRTTCGGDPTSRQPICKDTPRPDSPKPLRRTAIDERHHGILVQNYLQDYVQYLQTLGFLAMQTRRQESPRRRTSSSGSGTGGAFFRKDKGRNSQSGRADDLYLQKSLPAGTLIFHIGICEPFAFTKLYALEFRRLQPGVSLSGRLAHNVAALVEECDRIKFLLHTHSFTYDYHLRIVHSFVAGRPILRKGYNMVAFLEDFLKYYNKGPNFARDALATGIVNIKTGNNVAPTQLYNYVLSHEKNYDFRVLRMEPLYVESDGGQFNCDYVLARQTQHKLAYSFSSEKRNSDDFDMTLIVGHVEDQTSPLLRLKYFIILTSKREIYPTIGNDKNQGIFRTVLFTMSGGTPTATPPRSPNSQEEKDTALALLAAAGSELTKERDGEEGEKLIGEREEESGAKLLLEQQRMNLPDLFRPGAGEPNIIPESVHYVGYFSNHEQSMQTVMQLQMTTTETTLTSSLTRASSHCRRDHLWNRLHTNSPTNALSFPELVELLTLTRIEEMPLADLTTRGSVWFGKLVKVLATKYESHYRRFVSGEAEHHVILRENNVDVCTLVSIENRRRLPSVLVVFRELNAATSATSAEAGEERAVALTQLMAEHFVADACFHIWTENI